MKIIAIKERSTGNAEAGEMWVDAMIFEPTATLLDVLTWAQEPTGDNPTKHGRLMLSIADEEKENSDGIHSD